MGEAIDQPTGGQPSHPVPYHGDALPNEEELEVAVSAGLATRARSETYKGRGGSQLLVLLRSCGTLLVMTSSLSRRLVQPLQHVVRLCRSRPAWERYSQRYGGERRRSDPVMASTTKHDVVAQIVGATRCRFHADALVATHW